jgi:hypothetical protein
VDDLDLDKFLLQLEELLHFEVYLLLVGALELFGAVDVGVVEVGELDAVFAAELVYLAAETVDAVVHVVDDAVLLELQFEQAFAVAALALDGELFELAAQVADDLAELPLLLAHLLDLPPVDQHHVC